MLEIISGFLEFMKFFLKLILFGFGILIAVSIGKDIVKIVKLSKKLKNSNDVEHNFDVFSVEAEVLSFTEERVGQFDTSYDVDILYYVGNLPYYNKVTLLNRGSLRVGQKITLLCDNDDPEKITVSGGDESYALSKLIKGVIFKIIAVIVDFVIQFYGYSARMK